MDLRAYVAGIVAFGLIILAAGAGGIAYSKTYQANEQFYGPETDTLVVDYNETSTVDVENVPRVFENNETLTNETGQALDEGIDYEFNITTGEVHWINTSRTTAGENVTADVHYRGHEPTSAQINAFQPTLYTVLVYLGLATLGVVGIVGLGFAVMRGIGSKTLAGRR